VSVTEQRYQAVLAVISDGETVSSVTARYGVHRKTVHGWLARYESEGLEGLADRSHRPRSCPHQVDAGVEAAIATIRSAHPGWGMELWQMDVVGGFVLADGRRAKALSGVDDHSRFCVSAHLMLRESSPNVCDGLAAALRTYGVPWQIPTDNGKVFTGRYNRPPVEVLFDRICRENGIEHLHTQPRSPTTTGKIERFHRALRTEFRTDRTFLDLATAQAELDEWVHDYNHDRPHQALDMATPAARFLTGHDAAITPLRPPADTGAAHRPNASRSDGTWVTRREVGVKRSTAPQRRPRVTTSVTDQPT
jgi:transposase InsO family protein